MTKRITLQCADGLLEVHPGPPIRIVISGPRGRSEAALTPTGAVVLGRVLAQMTYKLPEPPGE